MASPTSRIPRRGLGSAPLLSCLLTFEPLDYLIYDRSDDLHALRTDLIHGVRVGMPWRIVDVDQIDSRGASANEGNVVVFLGDLLVGKNAL